MENQREKLRRLGYSPPEIESIISADRAIDRGEKLFELTPQQKKVEKEMRQAPPRGFAIVADRCCSHAVSSTRAASRRQRSR